MNIRDYADRVFYDVDPVEWIDMLRNARFVYTDSFTVIIVLEVSQTFSSILRRGYESHSLYGLGE